MSLSPSLSDTDFPYFQYTSLIGTHTLLLAFIAIVLPRGTLLITPLPPQQSSLDKPQHYVLEPITASPVWTLLWLCVGTGVCQAWWGGWMRVLWATYPHHEGNSSDNPEGLGKGSGGKIEALRNAWTNTLFVSTLFHVIIILFGAPISSYIARTYLLSLLLSVLTIFVPSYSLSLPIILNPFMHELSLQWIRLFIQRKIHTAVERAFVLPVLGTIIGSWVGAFPIPLDWDRPWQAWPLAPAYGALAGYVLGSWSSLIINTVLFLAGQDVPQQHTDVVPATGGPKATKKRNKKKRE